MNDWIQNVSWAVGIIIVLSVVLGLEILYFPDVEPWWRMVNGLCGCLHLYFCFYLYFTGFICNFLGFLSIEICFAGGRTDLVS